MPGLEGVVWSGRSAWSGGGVSGPLGAWFGGGGCAWFWRGRGLVWGMPGPGVVPSPREGSGPGGVPGGDLPGRLLPRTECILLECILVVHI